MTVRELYEKLGGDYESALSRILKESSMIKFLQMFAQDPQYVVLMEGLDSKDYKKVFAASHDMKGTCANLGLNQLSKSSSDICEAVRHGEPTIDMEPLIEQLKKDYEDTIQCINSL